MRKVIVSEFITLDGVVESPLKWVLDFHNEDSMGFKVDEMRHVDALLLGGITYDEFAEAWPARTGELADLMNGVRKYVVSSRAGQFGWCNTEALTGDLPAEVSALKEEVGRDILVVGSASLVQALARRGLIDEYRFFLCPIVLGTGRRLLTTKITPKRMSLIESRSFETGAVLLRYEAT